MKDAAAAYLRKRAVHGHWPAIAGRHDAAGLVHAVVIPVLAEYDALFHTLEDLTQNDPALLGQTLVLCVVNNRPPEIAGAPDCADNRRTLEALPDFAGMHPRLRLAWVDAASPGKELGAKYGVGLARKIGLDWALARLHATGSSSGALICLDADTRVAPDFLAALHRFYAGPRRWAAVTEYAHPVEGPDDACLPVLSYELFLRYQELGWHFAGSPYAYPAIGSTMSCTAAAYVAAGGMNRRQAGEDFYFLQQLAKTGHVARIRDTVVHPSGRASHRVPFGTGRKVGRYAADPEDAYRTYHPDTFRILQGWLTAAQAHVGEDGAALLGHAARIEPALAAYLHGQRFPESWDRIRSQGGTEIQRLQRFHQWFDAFRTLKLVHHLRDHGYPRQDLFDALATVMAWARLPAVPAAPAAIRMDVSQQRALLEALRAWRPD